MATSDNGTGTGRGGAFVALILGLISLALGALAQTRTRRTDRQTGKGRNAIGESRRGWT
ncbi:DUF6223 family protein [Streptomyces reniochalinae]|uniref:DUF6223 family protein n=1 Tax=Streptomyces reniochalinae TaxID=2250578 RepID=UPI0015F0570C|nr:DUF6223 family protein [Streptomyces reniochalinae]